MGWQSVRLAMSSAPFLAMSSAPFNDFLAEVCRNSIAWIDSADSVNTLKIGCARDLLLPHAEIITSILLVH